MENYSRFKFDFSKVHFKKVLKYLPKKLKEKENLVSLEIRHTVASLLSISILRLISELLKSSVPSFSIFLHDNSLIFFILFFLSFNIGYILKFLKTNYTEIKLDILKEEGKLEELCNEIDDGKNNELRDIENTSRDYKLLLETKKMQCTKDTLISINNFMQTQKYKRYSDEIFDIKLQLLLHQTYLIYDRVTDLTSQNAFYGYTRTTYLNSVVNYREAFKAVLNILESTFEKVDKLSKENKEEDIRSTEVKLEDYKELEILEGIFRDLSNGYEVALNVGKEEIITEYLLELEKVKII